MISEFGCCQLVTSELRYHEQTRETLRREWKRAVEERGYESLDGALESEVPVWMHSTLGAVRFLYEDEARERGIMEAPTHYEIRICGPCIPKETHDDQLLPVRTPRHRP